MVRLWFDHVPMALWGCCPCILFSFGCSKLLRNFDLGVVPGDLCRNFLKFALGAISGIHHGGLASLWPQSFVIWLVGNFHRVPYDVTRLAAAHWSSVVSGALSCDVIGRINHVVSRPRGLHWWRRALYGRALRQPSCVPPQILNSHWPAACFIGHQTSIPAKRGPSSLWNARSHPTLTD